MLCNLIKTVPVHIKNITKNGLQKYIRIFTTFPKPVILKENPIQKNNSVRGKCVKSHLNYICASSLPDITKDI